ncbi:MAG: N-acetylmuramoyl-L-alanine amidase [bacterium]
MKKIKTGLVLSISLPLISLVLVGIIFAQTNSLEDKVIALDAGHVGDYTGAIGYCGNNAVYESAVNKTVRTELAALLEDQGAIVFLVPQLETRKERVAAAEEAGADILISIHHNGSIDKEMDYTQTFITQTKFDKPLALFVHPALVKALGLPDYGITNSGFGMTVFGDHPAVLTEAYFITNTEAACDYLESQERVQAEVQGLNKGILDYFLQDSEIDGPLQKNK